MAAVARDSSLLRHPHHARLHGLQPALYQGRHLERDRQRETDRETERERERERKTMSLTKVKCPPKNLKIWKGNKKKRKNIYNLNIILYDYVSR